LGAPSILLKFERVINLSRRELICGIASRAVVQGLFCSLNRVPPVSVEEMSFCSAYFIQGVWFSGSFIARVSVSKGFQKALLLKGLKLLFQRGVFKKLYCLKV
jgi:hypothetical protein